VVTAVDGTYPVPRAGEITTASELDALPIGSVVLTAQPHKDTPFDDDGAYRLVFQRVYDGSWRRSGRARDTHPDYVLPATVLHRPDAPQPAQVPDDAVERAARAIEPDAWSDMDDMQWFHEYGEDSVNEAIRDRNQRKRNSLTKARAALAAARVGEAEGCRHESCDRLAVDRFSPCRKRGEGAVDREALSVGEVVAEADRRWPADYLTTGGSAAKRGAFRDGAAFALATLAARGGTAPTVTAERRALRKIRALIDQHSLHGDVPCDDLDAVLDKADL
jgi:hypothetical protein